LSVIQGNIFRCQWRTTKGYIVQYNNCRLACEGSEDIASEKSENRHFRRPHSHLTTPLQRTSANIHISLTLLETRIFGLHFCRWWYVGSSANFRTVLSESQKRQLISCWGRNRFYCKMVIQARAYLEGAAGAAPPIVPKIVVLSRRRIDWRHFSCCNAKRIGYESQTTQLRSVV